MLDCSIKGSHRATRTVIISSHPPSTSIDKATTYLCCVPSSIVVRSVHKQSKAASSPLRPAMASRSALIALLVVVSSVAAASAATLTVGDSSGWTLGVNYDNWANGKTFAAGDELVFNFATGAHDVVVVDKSGYDSCSTSNAANTIQTGPATVTLTAGTHYYICGISGHCSAGMKLAVTVGSGSSPSTPPTSPSTPTTPSAPAPGTGTGTPGSASVRLTAGPALAVAAAAVLVKLALF